ncbi:MAG TPA: sensor histidine kinase, partial [Thermoanaerobaculia bacterium]|nr:sensor histidine kinase [Thermoanaerobaculia bacterium]
MRFLPPKDPELGWTPYAWLIYLGFFLLKPVLGGASPIEWGATLSALGVFLGVYFWGFRQWGPRIVWAAAMIAALGFLCVPFNPGASVFWIYAGAFLGYSGPPRFALRWLALLLVLLGLQSWWLDLRPSSWITAVVFSVMICGVNLHFSERTRANAKLRATQEEVERLARTVERERIARDLHDLLGHTLSVITLKAELAGKLLNRDPERAAEEIHEVERISRDALREVREAVVGYRSEGLKAELARARLALESSGIAFEYLLTPLDVDPARETVLALAVREAVTNVIRHAGARSCRIAVEQGAGGVVRLEVRDDGRGGLAAEG